MGYGQEAKNQRATQKTVREHWFTKNEKKTWIDGIVLQTIRA